MYNKGSHVFPPSLHPPPLSSTIIVVMTNGLGNERSTEMIDLGPAVLISCLASFQAILLINANHLSHVFPSSAVVRMNGEIPLRTPVLAVIQSNFTVRLRDSSPHILPAHPDRLMTVRGIFLVHGAERGKGLLQYLACMSILSCPAR